MQIPQGYISSDLGIIPEDWEVKKLRCFLNLLTDYDANGSFADMAANVITYESPNYAWYVRATDLEQNTPLSQVHYTDKESYQFLKKSSLHGGEVLIAKRGDIGKVYLFKMKTARATVGPNLYLLKLNDSICPDYLFFFFKSATGQKLLKGINASTSLGAIYKEDVKNLDIIYPPLDEQSRIVSAISEIGELIAGLGNQIDKKRQIKEGAMQQLLTGKTRLPGFSQSWVKRKIGDICSCERGTMLTSDQYKSGNIPVIAGGKMPAGYHNEANRQGVSITVSCSGASAGYVAKYDIPIFATDCFTIGESEHYNVNYIFYILQHYQKQIYMLQTGGAQPHVHPKDLNPFEVLYTDSKEEQNAIAQILSDMDDEIYQLESERDKYTLIKQGMMQELLTGKTRLV